MVRKSKSSKRKVEAERPIEEATVLPENGTSEVHNGSLIVDTLVAQGDVPEERLDTQPDPREALGEALESLNRSPPTNPNLTPALDNLQDVELVNDSEPLEGSNDPVTSTAHVTELPDRQISTTNGTTSLYKSDTTAEPIDVAASNSRVQQTDIGGSTSNVGDPGPSVEDLSVLLQHSKEEERLLRMSLAELQAKADTLAAEKNQADSQYRNLFSKVTQMKSTLGTRLKQDSEELAQNRILIEDLETQNAALNETIAHMQTQAIDTVESHSATSRDLGAAQRHIATLSTKLEEVESLLNGERVAHREALDKSAMVAAEWENLAVEERSARDTLRDRIHDLEEQLASQNSAYDNLRSIVEQDDHTISKFKQTISELQETHRVELKETVESLQSTIDQLRLDTEVSDARVSSLRSEIKTLNGDLERVRPYEQEVKEKNLLVGKLRHEAVILNEHLTKALRLLKRGSSNDSVDRHLLNNLLLSFFQLPRQDSKRFEVMRILSSVLAWDEAQKEQAGLLRPGTSMTAMSARSPPASPIHTRGGLSRRTSGNLQLQAADFIGPNRESMSDLWINFLESEAAMEAAEQKSNS